jgi:hydroxymethylpyrimidine/phosphomethylpyrimidine kinase
MVAVALTIAGSDPSGGAGIQADLKTFHRFGVYGEAAITLLTVQNTEKVSRVEVLARELVRAQVEAVISDIPPGAAKTGALGNSEIIETIAQLSTQFAFPLVVDPVMISKHGSRLVTEGAIDAFKQQLLPRAALVTPNIPEAEALSGLAIHSQDDMLPAAARILGQGCKAVLIKGGHLTGEPVDFLHSAEISHFFHFPRVPTPHTHGTGCTYSAAITALLALGRPLDRAVSEARRFVQRAIQTGPALGHGNGPLNHFA